MIYYNHIFFFLCSLSFMKEVYSIDLIYCFGLRTLLLAQILEIGLTNGVWELLLCKNVLHFWSNCIIKCFYKMQGLLGLLTNTCLIR